MDETALIIVDVQNDFLPPDGALAVPGGRDIIPLIQALLDESWGWKSIIATQDYHPRGHISFASSHADRKPLDRVTVQDGWGREVGLTLWPDHCVQGTSGAEIEAGLRKSFEQCRDTIKLVRKGWDVTVENYSGFEGYMTEATDPSEPPNERIKQHHPAQSELTTYLHRQGVKRVVVVGLATDYCVNFTALSAIDAGLHTAVATPYVRGIDDSSVSTCLRGIEDKGGVMLHSEEQVKAWAK